MDAILKMRVAQGIAYSKIGLELSALTGKAISRSAAISRGRRIGVGGTTALSGRPLNWAKLITTPAHRPSLKPHTLPKPSANIPSHNAVKFIDRGPHQCAFPVSGEGAEMLVCGEPTLGGQSWCVRCAAIVWLPAAKGRAA